MVSGIVIVRGGLRVRSNVGSINGSGGVNVMEWIEKRRWGDEEG